MGSIFPPPPLSRSFSVPLPLPSISVASFLRPSLPYTSPIIALEQCQPSVGPQTPGLSPRTVLILSPWPHLLNNLLVSGSVENHCGLTKEMWDWFLPLQIEWKFLSRLLQEGRTYIWVVLAGGWSMHVMLFSFAAILVCLTAFEIKFFELLQLLPHSKPINFPPYFTFIGFHVAVWRQWTDVRLWYSTVSAFL